MSEHNPGTSKSVNVLGVRVRDVSVEQLHDHISSSVEEGSKCVIPNANVHCLNLAYEHAWLRSFLNDSPFVFIDGYGVILGAYILGTKLTHRITYADWMWRLAELCSQDGLSLYFLGAKPGVTERAAARLLERFPDLQIVGVHHGYFNRVVSSSENQSLIAAINAKKPNILIVGFGMPLQEKWLLENLDSLNVNVGLTGGAVFDYVAGDVRRGPPIITDHGFEWAARFIFDPRRLWKRYIIGNPLFFWRILKQRFGWIRFDE